MILRKVPLKNPQPDAKRFIDILMGRADGPPPLVEYLIDEAVRRPIVTELLDRPWVSLSENREAYWDQFIAFWHRLGYDFVRFEQSLGFPSRTIQAADTGAGSVRGWADEHGGMIRTWKDFENYPWPEVSDYDFSNFEYITSHLPEGMGLMTCHAAGMFEHLWHIMSFEGVFLALHDDRELVKAVSDAIGERMVKFYEHLLDLDNVIAIFPGDDMGFKTGTLIAPADLREFVLPWHKKFAAMAHEKGLPYFLHSCGNLEAIMGDLIEDVKIDGKHSYEDVIIPVGTFQARYGGKEGEIAVLGGMDIGILTERSPGEIRESTRYLMRTCGKLGRYAIGSGNSIPSYIPVKNYLAMVDEANDYKEKL